MTSYTTSSATTAVRTMRFAFVKAFPCSPLYLPPTTIGHQVQGVLFLCVNCATDYCLCSECERQRPHDSQHLFLKIYAPLPPDALAQGVLPLLPNLYAPSASTSSAGTQQ